MQVTLSITKASENKYSFRAVGQANAEKIHEREKEMKYEQREREREARGKKDDSDDDGIDIDAILADQQPQKKKKIVGPLIFQKIASLFQLRTIRSLMESKKNHLPVEV